MKMRNPISLSTIAIIDGAGAYGNILHYSLTIAFVGSAFIVFLYLWKTGRLGMDEEAKLQMMNESEDANEQSRE